MDETPEGEFYTYYTATSGGTKKLVEKLGGKNLQITSSNAKTLLIDRPTILVFPTYATRGKILPPPVAYFLSHKTNRDFVRGIIGTGDTNFNEHFCYAAIVVAERLNIPLIQKVELTGTESDITHIKNYIRTNNLLKQ